MPKVEIYEPALCCPTGICGVNVDPELLRISSVMNNLKGKNCDITRFNLSQNPDAFVKSSVVSSFLQQNGVAKLPITLVDGVISIEGRYPSNNELCEIFDLDTDELNSSSGLLKINRAKNNIDL